MTSKTKVRRAAAKGLSAGLSATTTLWLVGSSLFLAAPAAHATNDAVVSDITSTNPRIAPNGESELAVLGINIQMDPNTGNQNKQLQSLVVQMRSDDAAGNGEAALANIERVRIYSDSGLSGTGGQFDSQDAVVVTEARATGGGWADTLAGAAAAAATSIDMDVTATEQTDNTVYTMKIGVGAVAEIRTGTFHTNDDAAANACAAGFGANDCFLLTAGLTFAHAAGEAVTQNDALVTVTNSGGGGFVAFGAPCTNCHAGWEAAVAFGDTDGDAATDTLSYTPPTDDTGNNAGNDLFVTFLTAGGVANQTFAASIWPEGDAQIKLVDTTTPTNDILVGSNTTNNESKTVTFGSDGVAPQIQHAYTYDNDADGAVDRIEYVWSESMGTTVTTTQNFKDAVGGNASSVDTPGTDRIDLAANGTWLTTTVQNDTFRVDFTGDGQSDVCGGGGDAEAAGTYCGAAQSTGDTWTSQYDADGTGDLVDATGQAAVDQSISTTDKARPVILAAQVRDIDNDSKIDQLRVTGSESWGGSSTTSGITLRNTTNVPAMPYTLGAVSSFTTSGAAAPANPNDIIVISVTEAAQNDVGNVFTLDYAAASTLSDGSGNEARSLTGLAVTSGAEPLITRAQFEDADTDGQIDRLRLTFNQNVVVDNDGAGAEWAGLFTVSGFALAANPEDADCNNVAENATENGADAVLCILLTESGVADTDEVPDVTAVASVQAGANALCVSADADCADAADVQMTAKNSAAIAEEDNAAPEMTSLVHYGDTDAIWENGETVQAVFSEPIDPASVGTSWSNDQILDFANLPAAAALPDTGTIAVSGRVIILTATQNATVALTNGADQFNPAANEIKDFALVPNSAADAVNTPLNTNPTVAPGIARISTADRNGNGVLDALLIEFNGLISGTSLVASEFVAARGANYSGGPGVYANATQAVTPDLTVTSVKTENGGNDSRVYVNFTESGEDTGQFPQVAYLQGTMADLAGNKVASFNRDGADPTKIAAAPVNVSVDRAKPVVVYKLLRDRDGDKKIDQLLLVFSEGIDNDTVNANALANAGHVSDGLAVSGKTIATNGNLQNNLNYQQFTFASTNAQFVVDVNEGASADSSLPGVSYVSSGQFRDNQGNLLASFSAGGEVSDFGLAPPPPQGGGVGDGSLVRGSGPAVYVLKVVGGTTFKRHVLSDQMGVWYPHLAPFWSNVQSVSDETLNGYTLSAWVRVAGTTAVYEINDDRTAHHLTCDDDAVPGQDCANEWVAAGGNPDGIYEINSAEWGYYIPSNPVILPDQPN